MFQEPVQASGLLVEHGEKYIPPVHLERILQYHIQQEVYIINWLKTINQVRDILQYDELYGCIQVVHTAGNQPGMAEVLGSILIADLTLDLHISA